MATVECLQGHLEGRRKLWACDVLGDRMDACLQAHADEYHLEDVLSGIARQLQLRVPSTTTTTTTPQQEQEEEEVTIDTRSTA